MNKSKVLLTAGAVFLSAALAVTFLNSSEKTSITQLSEVYTWDCEYPDQEPEAITITCGDGGQYIDGITWNKWDLTGAEGTGTYHVNDCSPNCAEGNFLSTQVKVELSNLVEYKGKNYLRTLTFTTLTNENLPESGQSFYEWDVMEFAEMMAE